MSERERKGEINESEFLKEREKETEADGGRDRETLRGRIE